MENVPLFGNPKVVFRNENILNHLKMNEKGTEWSYKNLSICHKTPNEWQKNIINFDNQIQGLTQ